MRQYKRALLAGIGVGICLMFITANLRYFSLLGATIRGDTQEVLQSMKNDMLQQQDQNQLTFKKGIRYLLKQEDDNKEVQAFFEENFNTFLPIWQKEILVAYGKKGLKIPMSRAVIDTILKSLNTTALKGYIEQLSVEDLEHGLSLVYGHNPEVTPEFVDTLYLLLQMYPNQLQFIKIEFNLYDVLQYDGEDAVEKIKFIINKVEPSVARENLFKHLRKEILSVDVLNEWIEFFNSIGIITATEYISFNQYYGNICLLRNQQRDLDNEEQELQNQMNQIESKIKVQLETIDKAENLKAPIVQEINRLDTELETLNDFSTIEFYIERPAGTGNNEYIASLPRNGLFRKRPSEIKYIIKMTRTMPYEVGIYELNIYTAGTKKAMDGNEYNYFIEVSNAQYNEIAQKEIERLMQVQQLDDIEAQITDLQNEVDTIKEQYQYNEIQKNLNLMENRRLEYTEKIEEEVIQIRKLFELNQVTA